jgi:predicted neutral ceramidase superfamily lipid hydrolase
MPRVSAAFFLTGGLFVLCGMGMGMYMGGAEDFRLAPAHAHLNLLGWVTMALYGTFYALTSKTMLKSLAWLNYTLSTIGVLLAIPALGYMLATGSKAFVLVMIAGEFLTVASLGVFLISAVRELTRNRAADVRPLNVADSMRMAAE